MWGEGGISASFAVLEGKKRTFFYYIWEEKPPLNYFRISLLREAKRERPCCGCGWDAVLRREGGKNPISRKNPLK